MQMTVQIIEIMGHHTILHGTIDEIDDVQVSMVQIQKLIFHH